MKAARIAINIIVLLYLVALLAFLATGGYSFEALSVKITSTRLQPIITGLLIASVIRFAIWTGVLNFSLLMLSALIGIGIAETALRVLNQSPMAQWELVQIHRPSDVYEYELVPNAQGIGLLGENISINEAGMRDTPIDANKDASNIAIVGDSFTFGMGVELDQTFVKQLQTQLREKNPEIEVTNYGVIGYSLWHYLEVLDRRVVSRRPKLVIVALFLDDILAPLRPTNVLAKNPFADTSEDDFHESHLWNMLRNASRRVTA